MSDIILHIGLNKTGTSSIQDFLALNAHTLLSEGLCYPKTGRDGAAHHVLSRWIATPEAERDLNKSPLAKALRAEIEGMPLVVLSSEDLHTHGVRGARVLTRLFEGHRVRVVLYLREHLSYLASWYQQNIQASHLSSGFDTFCYLTFKPMHRIADAWAEGLGAENVITRLYDRSSLIGGDVLKDFAQVIGVQGDLGRYRRKPYENNPSVSGNLLFAKRLINNLIDKPSASSMVSELDELAKLKPEFRGPMFVAADLVSYVVGMYKGDRKQLLDRYGIRIEERSGDFKGSPYPDFSTLRSDWDLIQASARAARYQFALAQDLLVLGDVARLAGGALR